MFLNHWSENFKPKLYKATIIMTAQNLSVCVEPFTKDQNDDGRDICTLNQGSYIYWLAYLLIDGIPESYLMLF